MVHFFEHLQVIAKRAIPAAVEKNSLAQVFILRTFPSAIDPGLAGGDQGVGKV